MMNQWKWARIRKLNVSTSRASILLTCFQLHVSRAARISCTALFAIPAKFRLQRRNLDHLVWNSLNFCLLQTVFFVVNWVHAIVNRTFDLKLIEVGRLVMTFVGFVNLGLFYSQHGYWLLLFYIAVPGSISKKTKNRNIFSSFFCCFGAQSTAAGTPCTTVTHTNHNHNHNHNENSLSSEEKDPKVSVLASR